VFAPAKTPKHGPVSWHEGTVGIGIWRDPAHAIDSSRWGRRLGAPLRARRIAEPLFPTKPSLDLRNLPDDPLAAVC